MDSLRNDLSDNNNENKVGLKKTQTFWHEICWECLNFEFFFGVEVKSEVEQLTSKAVRFYEEILETVTNELLLDFHLKNQK